ncbi:D-glycero-beta-D-manno-heptose 1,7-bisphosphate 7-phosphatase [Thiohalomonas denitrificans]|uniref:D,D-heptose 1,7-bisphosphate phosphatase n=1 Tax=Thiohalomonas denitrificans TaxID=415747 RepID=A0A1G5QTN5_9GAMM|nr:D-glycero-beta-D-manno-heptose 1,7-bisphosphate 7-phosphatase [Thiohalomonas denitrificans]SCZ65215.1 D-glycero-D-manno-heptose 1,7-bisphosphate phosphatase [Thiohalomonas denitrificans]
MKLVILDRDGVINEDSDDYVKSPEEFNLIRGSAEAIARLNQSGYRVAVATNQSGIARDYFNVDALNRMHSKLRRELGKVGGEIELIAYCPHGPDDACACRKPEAGLLKEIGERMGVDLEGVPAIGDSLRDLQAARAVGARPILVKTGKGQRTLESAIETDLEGVTVFDDLAAAVTAILEEG